MTSMLNMMCVLKKITNESCVYQNDINPWTNINTKKGQQQHTLKESTFLKVLGYNLQFAEVHVCTFFFL